SNVVNVEVVDDKAITLADGREAWVGGYSAEYEDGTPMRAVVASTARAGRLFTLQAYGQPGDLERERPALDAIIASIRLEAPRLHGVPRNEALFQLGGESSNPRAYDPATGGGNPLVFSGLVSFNPQLEIVPDLTESWDIGDDGAVYTFHLRRNALFHDGRPVTAQDVIYSWERAADPATDSDTVLTYLGDIVGVKEKRDGKADHIGGLKAIDDHTLQVTIDAPKPYFLMKLAFGTAAVVDRANVESGTEWYRTPNGTGPYKLIRWDRFKLQVYERNEDFYLGPPSIRFIVSQLFAGVGLRLYETGDIDITGAGAHDADRLRDPQEPLNADLREGVSLCTSFVTFDVDQPPFDDPRVRQAFALAVDKQRYIDVALRGVSLPAHGVYPPALPGHNLNLNGLEFDPELARQRLSESTYGSAAALPPIVFNSSGFGSDVNSDVAALAQMWRTHLGVTIRVENLEPNVYFDELHDGNHGQLFSYGWCADYPDPENFADALFHSQAQQNLGHYANPDLDALLEAARVERNVDKRIQMYQQAEQIIVEDAAGIFLDHGLSFILVKPHIKGYVLTPLAVPIERYLSIDPSGMER
ncbi:MAG: peptide ABC transporter substrate-binding protein, partial [Anaerolineae bacterium]